MLTIYDLKFCFLNFLSILILEFMLIMWAVTEGWSYLRLVVNASGTHRLAAVPYPRFNDSCHSFYNRSRWLTENMCTSGRIFTCNWGWGFCRGIACRLHAVCWSFEVLLRKDYSAIDAGRRGGICVHVGITNSNTPTRSMRDSLQRHSSAHWEPDRHADYVNKHDYSAAQMIWNAIIE